jgi:hypothetical protein
MASLDHISWGEIKSIQRPQEFFAKGDTKTVELYDGQSVVVELVAFNRDGTKMQFIMRDLLEFEYPMNQEDTNKGGWKNSRMRNHYLKRIFQLLPKDLQDVIVSAKKIASGETTHDLLWLPSETEVFGRNEYSSGNDGEQYDCFKDTNNRIKRRDGRKWYWWLRSPFSGYTSYFCYVSSDGFASYNSASNSLGVCLGFNL